mgnify:CR=1 FL=1
MKKIDKLSKGQSKQKKKGPHVNEINTFFCKPVQKTVEIMIMNAVKFANIFENKYTDGIFYVIIKVFIFIK